MIAAVIEMFPAAEDVLPEDLDDDDEPRPRGAEAVRRILAETPDRWFSVQQVLAALVHRGWGPESSNPANATRTALERLVEAGVIEKMRSTKGPVIYKYEKPDEEPF